MKMWGGEQQLRKTACKTVHNEDEIQMTIWKDDNGLWDKDKFPREPRHNLKNYSEIRIRGDFEKKQETTNFKQTIEIKVFITTDVQENSFQRSIKIYINPYPTNVENRVSS